MRGYYKALAIVMTNGSLPGPAIKKWPTRVPASKIKYSLDQLCQLYVEAGGK